MMKRLCLLLLIAAMANIAGAAPDDTTSQSQVNPNEISQESANQALSEAMQLTRFQKAVAFIKRNKACFSGEECPLALSASLNFSVGFAIGVLAAHIVSRAMYNRSEYFALRGLAGQLEAKDFIFEALRFARNSLILLTGLPSGLISIIVIDKYLRTPTYEGPLKNCYRRSADCTDEDIQRTYLIQGFKAGFWIRGALGLLKRF